jgi:hypothetical protein
MCPECGGELRVFYTTQYGTVNEFDFYLLCGECDYENYEPTDKEVEEARREIDNG